MTLYVYCPRPSNGALELVHALGALRLRRFDGMDFWRKNKRVKLQEGDIVVCWGSFVPELEGIRVLNSADHITKKDELNKVREAGLPCVAVIEHPDPDDIRNGFALKRRNNHQGGSDLLRPPSACDYFTAKNKFREEYRIHSFAGKAIRSGKKVVRDGFTLAPNEMDWKPNENLAHPWVRSFDGGWRVNYDGFSSTTRMRNIATKAVSALGLTFGAVDIGDRADGAGLMVIEVNRAPGIEGHSVESYVRAIKKWIDNKPEEVADADQGPQAAAAAGQIDLNGLHDRLVPPPIQPRRGNFIDPPFVIRAQEPMAPQPPLPVPPAPEGDPWERLRAVAQRQLEENQRMDRERRDRLIREENARAAEAWAQNAARLNPAPRRPFRPRLQNRVNRGNGRLAN